MKLLGRFASRRIALATAQLWADELQDRIRVEIPTEPQDHTKVFACEIVVEAIHYQEPAES